MSATATDFPADLQRLVLRSKIPGVKQFCAFAGWDLFKSPSGPAAHHRVQTEWHDSEQEALTHLEIRILEALA